MKRLLPLLLCLMPLTALANRLEGDSLSLSERVYQQLITRPLLVSHYADNVALHHLAYPTSLSSFGLRHQWRSETTPMVAERGKGESLYQAFASAYLKPSHTQHLWGDASYTNGVRRQVNWNTTSDIHLLYPYLVSDEVGGDLKHERYSFGGGYSGLWDALRLSAQLQYTAQQEFRVRDPRPRNITSHLGATAGAAFAIGNQIVGGNITYGIYKQRSSVASYSPAGATLQRLMSGLGDSFVRFDTNDPTLYYRLNALGGSLHTMPHHHTTGLFAEASYLYSKLTQILSDLNEVPIHHYNEHQASVAIGYQYQPKRQGVIYSIHLTSQVELRDGIEHIVGEPKAGTYPVVGYLHNLRLLHHQNSLSFTISQQAPLHWYGRATLSYQHLSIKKLEPHKRLLSQRLTTSLAGGVAKPFTPHKSLTSHQTLSLDAEIAYTPRLSSTLELPLASMRESQITHLQHLSNISSASALQLLTGVSYSHTFGDGANEWGLQLSCQYHYAHYLPTSQSIHQHQLQTSLRLIF